MVTKKSIADYIFLILLGLLLFRTVYLHFNQGYVLFLNNYLAITGWLATIILFITGARISKYAISILLLTGLFELFNFTSFATQVGINAGDTSAPPVGGISINPILLLLCFAYYITKRKTINGFISKHLQDSDKKRAEKHNKMVEFYYQKFSGCNTEELARIVQNYNDYPPEARIALNRLQKQNSN